ncbi:MAG TPA: ABC transporter substrate-binding protein [Chloroflexota bacterium]
MSVSRYAVLALVALVALGGPTAAAATRPPVAAAEPAAVAPAAPLPQLTRIRTGLIPIIPSAVFFVPMDKGYFAQEGVEIDWQPIQVTTEAISQVAAGNLELASATVGAAVLNGFARGVETKIVSGLHGNPPSGPGGDPMLVRKDLYDSSAVRDAAGLRGRKVAGNSVGVYTEYAINGVMRTAGLSVADVDFTPVAFPDVPQALANNAVDAAFVPEPFATASMEAGYAAQIVPEFLRGAQITVLVAGPTYLRDRAVAEGFMRGLLRGLNDLYTQGWNSPENAAIIEKYTRVPAATVQKIIPQYGDPDGRINWESLADQQRFYMDRGELTYAEPLDLLQWSDDSIRQAALRALGR